MIEFSYFITDENRKKLIVQKYALCDFITARQNIIKQQKGIYWAFGGGSHKGKAIGLKPN